MIFITIIAALFWGIMASLLISLFGILPQVTLVVTQFTSAITLIIGYMLAWDWMLPIHELLSLVLFEFTVDMVFWHWHVARYIIHFFRGTTPSSRS